MRKIKFNNEEVKTLKEIIAWGESQYESYFGETSKNILNKIRVAIFHFDKKETQLLKSYTSNWINNYKETIEKLYEKFLIEKNPDFNNMSEGKRELMCKINIVFTLKSKLFKEVYISFKEALE